MSDDDARPYEVTKVEQQRFVQLDPATLQEGTDLESINQDSFLRGKNGKPLWIITNEGFDDDKDARSFVGGRTNYDMKSIGQLFMLINHGLREHHKICDLGCGDLSLGRLLIPFLNKGCYFGIEPIDWVLRDGVENNTGTEILTMKDVKFSDTEEFEFEIFNTEFDFIIAGSVFSHAHPTQITRCLHKAKDVLAKDGVFLASFVEGDDNMYLPGWVYPGVNVYTKEFMYKMAEGTGLKAKRFLIPAYHQVWMRYTHED